MNTFIYGTGNPAKLTHMKNMLEPLDVKIIGLKETGIAIPEAMKRQHTIRKTLVKSACLLQRDEMSRFRLRFRAVY